MSKTPEQMAEEWALGTFKEPLAELMSEDQYAYSVAVDAYLAGYHSRDEEVKQLKEEIAMLKAELREVGNDTRD